MRNSTGRSVSIYALSGLEEVEANSIMGLSRQLLRMHCRWFYIRMIPEPCIYLYRKE